jgi:hypothetical protein
MPTRTHPRQSVDWGRPRFTGQTFVLARRMHSYYRKQYEEAIEAEGGSVVKDVTAALDFVLVHDSRSGGPSAAEKRAKQFNGKAASIRIIDREEFFGLLVPDREEALAMLAAGLKGAERWQQLRRHQHDSVPQPDIAGADFRKAVLRGVDFWRVGLDGVDFRGADLSDAGIGETSRLRADNACLARARMGKQTDGSFVRADLQGASMDDLQGCKGRGREPATAA